MNQRSLVPFTLYGIFAFFSPLPLLMGQGSDDRPTDRKAYEQFALANPGAADRGKELFSNLQRTTCSLCHSVDGSGSKAGPDLRAIGDKFKRADLIKSVLEPSSTLAIGYGTTVITTKNGEIKSGVIKSAATDWVELMGIEGKAQRILLDDIAKQESTPVSLMPEGLHSALSLGEFADLIAYMQSLHLPKGNSDSATLDEIPLAKKSVGLDPFFSPETRFDHPVWMGEMPGHAGKFIVLEQGGMSWIVERAKTGEKRRPFLDLRTKVRFGGATGLLALAFHPTFAQTGRYVIKYQVVEAGRISTLVEERRFMDDFLSDSGDSRHLLKMPGVTQDHNGGALEFGPDGYLYVGMGDTGPQRDPQGHGQDMGTLLSKILRIDIDQPSGDLPYSIPQSNPFRDQVGARPEIWALGFREPWRLSFDRDTKEMWVGDVGQDRVEEISIVRAGENLGWNVYEGADHFSDRYRREGETYIAPIVSYSHRLGVSVTGGFVYRGKTAPKMNGWYVFGDFETRRLWAVRQEGRQRKQIVEIGRAPTRVVSFCEDLQGELTFVGYDDGIIYRLNLGEIDTTPLQIRTILPTAETDPVPWRSTFSQPEASWTNLEFDDAMWRESPGGFGTAGTPGAVVRTEWRSRDIWMRRSFSLPESANSNVSGERRIALRIHHDEDAEIYLNGTEIAKLPRWTQGYVNIPLSAEALTFLRPGSNVLSIHCRQNTGGQYIDAGLVEFVEGGN